MIKIVQQIDKKGRDDMVSKLALGATGVALAAGAIAAGVALANKDNRKALQKRARSTAKGFSKVRKVLEHGQERFQTIQHRIGGMKKIASKKAKRMKKAYK